VSSFGDRLKRTRENRKLTLDQVATATKISIRMLKALEEETFDQLPGGIFNKGFVRSYARFLGIDEAQAVNDYMQASGAANQEPAAEDAELKAIAERKDKERERQRGQSKGIPWGLTAAVLLVICLLLAVWSFYSRDRQASVPVHSQSPKPAGKAASEDANSSIAGPTLTAVSQSSTVSSASISPAIASQPDVQSGAFTVEVQAKQDSWLTVTADGKPTFSDMVVAPGTKSFGAQRELVIRAGNAGGLDISFNGQKIPAIGSEGEVRTVTFSPSGLQPSSPKPIE